MIKDYDLTNPIYNNENKARLHLERLRWGHRNKNIFCSHCGCTGKIKKAVMKNKPSAKNPKPKNVKGYYHCGDCRKRFTIRTGTIYEKSHIPLHKWCLATQLLCSSKKGMSAHQLHRMLGITYKSAWFMFHRVREGMSNSVNPNDPLLGEAGDSVQADETYFGRKDVVVKRTIRGKPSHSSKMSVVSLISEGKSRTFHVDSANNATIRGLLDANVSRNAELHTDESPLYKAIGQEFVAHKTVKHTAGEFMRDGAHVNGAENYFSIFKRGMRGVYQKCSEKHLQRYLHEFDFRYNTRDVDDFTRSIIAHKQAVGKRLTYKDTST